MFKEVFSRNNFIFTERFLNQATAIPQTYLFRGIFVFILLILLSSSVTSQTSSGRSLFQALIICNFFFVTVLSCSAFGSLITEEKEQGTLGLLMITPRNPISVISAKALPRLIEILCNLFLELPVLLIAIALGGIDIEQILQIAILLPFYIAQIAGIGIFISTNSYNSKSATIGVLLFLAGIFLIPKVYDGIQQDMFSWLPALNLSEYFYYLNTCEILYKIMSFQGSIYDVLIFAGLTAVFSFLLIFKSIKILDSMDYTLAVSKNIKKPKAKSTNRQRRAWTRALAGKEFHINSGKSGVITKCIFYCGLGYFVHYFFHENIHSPFFSVLGIVYIFLALIELLSYSSKSFIYEVQDKQLSSLLSLPYTNSEILLQKIQGAFVVSLVPLFFAVFCMAIEPGTLIMIFKTFTYPQTYLAICFYLFMLSSFYYSGLIARVKKNFLDQLAQFFAMMVGFMLTVVPVTILFNEFPKSCTLYIMIVTVAYIKSIIDKMCKWMYILAEQEN